MSEYTGYVESPSGSEHRIDVEFEYTVSNDGIGSYEYWGAKCYDAGTDYMEVENITEAWIVRDGIVDNKEDIPKCAKLAGSYKDHKTGKTKYRWEHFRKISDKSDCLDKICEDIAEDYDWRSDYEPEPDYEPYYD